MTSASVTLPGTRSILSIFNEARMTLADAETHVQILEARKMARRAYEEAKSMARIAKARQAHGDLSESLKQLMGEAVAMQFLADAKLADEVDAAQARGELRKPGERSGKAIAGGDSSKPTQREAGVDPYGLENARKIRDALKERPDVVKEVVAEMIEGGRDISEASVRREVVDRGGMTKAEMAAKHKEVLSELRNLDPMAISLHGQLEDFEKDGLLARDFSAIIGTMGPRMQADTVRLAGLVIEWLLRGLPK